MNRYFYLVLTAVSTTMFFALDNIQGIPFLFAALYCAGESN
jgi:hypothetical protein